MCNLLFLLACICLPALISASEPWNEFISPSLIAQSLGQNWYYYDVSENNSNGIFCIYISHGKGEDKILELRLLDSKRIIFMINNEQSNILSCFIRGGIAAGSTRRIYTPPANIDLSLTSNNRGPEITLNIPFMYAEPRTPLSNARQEHGNGAGSGWYKIYAKIAAN